MLTKAEKQQERAVQALCTYCAREFMCVNQIRHSKKLYLTAEDQLLNQICRNDHSELEFLRFHRRNNYNLLNC